MLTIRATQLEAYRRVCETPWGSEEELLAQLRWDLSEPSWQMRAGTAWHAVLEGKGRRGNYADGTPIIVSGEYTFRQKDADAAMAHIGPGGLCEVQGQRQYILGTDDVKLTGRCDWLRGLIIQDHKTTFSPPDLKHYEASLQWRSYLLIHEATVFRYNCFFFTEPDQDGLCELRDIQSVTFWRYPQMERDVRQWVGRMVEWMSERGLA